MLKYMNFLTYENKNLTINRIYDYVFFTLYYAPKLSITTFCKQIRQLQLPVLTSLQNRPIRQKWILCLFFNKWDSLLAKSLRLFRWLKHAHY